MTSVSEVVSHNGRVSALVETPEPPYTAVVFTSERREDDRGYAPMMERMVALVAEQPGFPGHDAVRDGDRGTNVSYWVDAAATAGWRSVAEHGSPSSEDVRPGTSTTVRVATVERACSMRQLGAADDLGRGGSRHTKVPETARD